MSNITNSVEKAIQRAIIAELKGVIDFAAYRRRVAANKGNEIAESLARVAESNAISALASEHDCNIEAAMGKVRIVDYHMREFERYI